MDDIGKSESEVVTKKKLERLVEGRDPVTKQYQKGTLLGVLREKFTLGNTIMEQNVDIEYPNGVRSEELITLEAHITIATEELIQVQNRV